MNDGTANKPYFMSKGLMSILGKKNLKPGEKKKCCGCCWNRHCMDKLKFFMKRLNVFLHVYILYMYIYILLYMQSLSQLLNCKNLLLCRFIIVHFLLLFVIDEIIVLFYILSYPRSLSCTFFGGEANIELWLYFRDHILTILINRIWSLYGWAIKMYANNWNPFFFSDLFFQIAL